MDKLNINQVKDMILFMAQEIIDNKSYLTEVDLKIGDGDHGIGMETGFLNVKKVIEPKQYASVNQLFKEIGMAMLNSMGGASGVIFSSIFLGAKKDTGKEDELTAEEFTEMMENGIIELELENPTGEKVTIETMLENIRNGVLVIE